MAADIQAPQGEWVSAYALSGILEGTPIVLQNKGVAVLVQESAAEPTTDLGWFLPTGGSAEISSGASDVWIKALPGDSVLFVQEIGDGVIMPAASQGSGGAIEIVSASIRQCMGRQTVSVTTGAVSTLTVPLGANGAILQVDGNSSVSMTLDGVTNPTATIGLRLDDGVMFYADSNLFNVKMIARTGTVNVQVSYFDRP